MGHPQYRVLHVVDHSWPILSGYSIRTANIARAERELGFEVKVLSGPNQQVDSPESEDSVHQDVSYIRTRLKGLRGLAIGRRVPVLRELSIVSLLEENINALLREGTFDVVHAHSPSLCGLAAYRAAKRRGIPFVYEIRGFWEDSAADRSHLRQASLQYRLRQRLETFVARKAAIVVGIAASIVEQMNDRGISSSKLRHVSNGVDTSQFIPQPKDTELTKRIGIQPDETVFGFVGSMWRFEGIPWLVKAVSELRKTCPRVRLLLIGHGQDEQAVRAEIDRLGAQSYIQFLGRIPHDSIRRYYSVMDVLVYPRLRSNVTERVTPLKPLEAMAQEKAVLVSDVGGLLELVSDGNTGLVFKAEEISDFCDKAKTLCEHVSLRRELGVRARADMIQNWSWEMIARKYERIYAQATNNLPLR
jgi:glycogen(starch) synthase